VSALPATLDSEYCWAAHPRPQMDVGRRGSRGTAGREPPSVSCRHAVPCPSGWSLRLLPAVWLLSALAVAGCPCRCMADGCSLPVGFFRELRQGLSSHPHPRLAGTHLQTVGAELGKHFVLTGEFLLSRSVVHPPACRPRRAQPAERAPSERYAALPVGSYPDHAEALPEHSTPVDKPLAEFYSLCWIYWGTGSGGGFTLPVYDVSSMFVQARTW